MRYSDKSTTPTLAKPPSHEIPRAATLAQPLEGVAATAVTCALRKKPLGLLGPLGPIANLATPDGVSDLFPRPHRAPVPNLLIVLRLLFSLLLLTGPTGPGPLPRPAPINLDDLH